MSKRQYTIRKYQARISKAEFQRSQRLGRTINSLKMSFANCIRGFCNVVSEFMRLILFFVTMIFMMVSIYLFAKSFQARFAYNTIEISSTDSCFIVIQALAIYLIALSILGIHATFFSPDNSLLWVSLSAS